jgi:hypothetical protein
MRECPSRSLEPEVYGEIVSRLWYETACKAFNGSQAAHGDGGIIKARPTAFVVALRDRGVRLRSVNTTCRR